MKVSKNLVLMVAAGAAIAGLAGFLFGTEKGRNTTKRLQQSGSEVANKMGVLLKDGRKKFEAMRERHQAPKPFETVNAVPPLQELA